jgi:hypothetical protein
VGALSRRPVSVTDSLGPVVSEHAARRPMAAANRMGRMDIVYLAGDPQMRVLTWGPPTDFILPNSREHVTPGHPCGGQFDGAESQLMDRGRIGRGVLVSW